MSSFGSESARKSCRNQSKSIKFVMSCAGHVDGMKKINNSSEPSETFQRRSGRPLLTVEFIF